MMRTKLGLTEKELMETSWIYLNLQMLDFPYYDYKKQRIITSRDEANEVLKKYMVKK